MIINKIKKIRIPKKTASIFLTTVILIFTLVFIFKNKEILINIRNINIKYALPISLLAILSLYLNGLFLKIFTDPFKIKLKEHFLLSISTSFFNLITPLRGGMGVRAIYLKKVHNLDYSKFMAGFFGNYVIIMLTNSIMALLIFTIIFVKENIVNIPATLIFLSILSVCFFVIIYKKTIKEKGKISKTINLLIKGWHEIIKWPKLIQNASIITLLNTINTAIIIKIIFLSLNQNITVLQSLFFSIISVLTFFVNITPGSIGVTEGLLIFSGAVLKLDQNLTIAAALIYRIITSTIILTLGPISNFLLLKVSKKSSKE